MAATIAASTQTDTQGVGFLLYKAENIKSLLFSAIS
jgi:hypothetical protein